MNSTLNWRLRCACGRPGADRSVFFGPDDEDPAGKAAREAEAISVCSRCPVTGPCLEWHLSFPAQHGVAGGVGEDERRDMRHAYVKRLARRAAA